MMNYLSCIFIFLGCLNTFRFADANDKDWDILIFTQHWPLTVCFQWKEVLPQHSCTLPPKKNIWTVHGIWPTKLGTKGPLFCNSSLHFNQTVLAPVEKELEQYWTDIHNGTGSIYKLWKHEWKKHGTCAAAIPALDSEIKYFGQGLKWLHEYDMSNVLNKSGIEPNGNYTPQTVWDAVQKTLGKNPAIQCIVDPKSKESYLFEIRICFDKNLTLVDCDGIKGHREFNNIKTNCPNHNMTYPGILPPLPKKTQFFEISPVYKHNPWAMEVLRIIQFLQWMTF